MGRLRGWQGVLWYFLTNLKTQNHFLLIRLAASPLPGVILSGEQSLAARCAGATTRQKNSKILKITLPFWTILVPQYRTSPFNKKFTRECLKIVDRIGKLLDGSEYSYCNRHIIPRSRRGVSEEYWGVFEAISWTGGNFPLSSLKHQNRQLRGWEETFWQKFKNGRVGSCLVALSMSVVRIRQHDGRNRKT